MSSAIYANALPQAFEGNLRLDGSHTLNMALLTAGYTPDLVGHVHYSDVSASETAGSGYTTGGAALVSPSLILTPANSWTHLWGSALTVAYGQIIRPTSGNGHLYRAVVAGTTGGSSPAFPTVEGETVSDSGVVWACVGDAALVFSTGAPLWPGATFSTAFGVIYDTTTGVLVTLEDFGGTESPAAQTFVVTPDPILGWAVFTPPS